MSSDFSDKVVPAMGLGWLPGSLLVSGLFSSDSPVSVAQNDLEATGIESRRLQILNTELHPPVFNQMGFFFQTTK